MDLVEIAKKDRDKKYRRSYLHGLNPRSDTYVRRGTTVKRSARTGGGAVAGSVVGGVVGGAAGTAARNKELGVAIGSRAGSALGAAAGGTYGRQKNLDSGDVKAYHRKSGKRATRIVSTGGAPALNYGWYSYPKDKKKRKHED